MKVVAKQQSKLLKNACAYVCVFVTADCWITMAEKPSVMLTDGGLWNTRKPQYSPATTKLLKSKEF
jgi:hypothetical protein